MLLMVRSFFRRFRFLREIVFKKRYRAYLAELRKQAPFGQGKKILIINHHFDQDIEGLRAGCSENLQFFELKCMPFFNEAQLYFLTREERDGIIPYDRVPAGRKLAYREVCRGLFRDLQQIFSFEMVLMPSDSFWWLREFLEVCKENGVKRVVLDKEGTISPYSFDVHALQIKEKFPFVSDYLLVWSERQKQFWMRAGAPEDAIKVVGQPRSEFFFQKNRWQTRRDLGVDGYEKHILLFTFDIDAYINVFPEEETLREGYTWVPLRNEVTTILVDFVKDHPTVCLTIKVHPQQADIDYIRNFVGSVNLTNVRLAEGAAISNQLIVNSDLVIGFQTTALTEAMLTDKPVFYTAWGETERKVRSHLIPFHDTKGLEVISSPERFVLMLNKWFTGEKVGGDLAERKMFTDYWLFADGHVFERINRSIREILEG